jgi:hypothetical protein
VAALLALAALSPVITRGWAEACLTRLDACPPGLRAPVLTAAAYNAFNADDYPLSRRGAEQVLAEPAPSDPDISLCLRALLAAIFTFTGQPERAIGFARELGHDAAEQGIEYAVVFALADEALAWTRAGDYAAARPHAIEAVEIARRVRNPAMSAFASFAAADAIWHSEPRAALLLIEDSLALLRAGADDTLFGSALMLAAAIRARTGDLPGALAALQEAMLQHHADGTRLLLGGALRVAAGMLARVGEAGAAAVLSGALAAHFPTSTSARTEQERAATAKTRALARDTLGAAAYDAAAGRGAAMDEDQVVGYAVGELQRVAALLAQPGAQAPHAPPGPAPGPQAAPRFRPAQHEAAQGRRHGPVGGAFPP